MPDTPENDAQRRIYAEDAPMELSDGDDSTSPEAMAYLTEHGVEAWQRKYQPRDQQ